MESRTWIANRCSRRDEHIPLLVSKCLLTRRWEGRSALDLIPVLEEILSTLGSQMEAVTVEWQNGKGHPKETGEVSGRCHSGKVPSCKMNKHYSSKGGE